MVIRRLTQFILLALTLVIVGGWAGTSFAGPLQRAHLAVIAGSTVASGGCDTEVISNTASISNRVDIGDSSSLYYIGQTYNEVSEHTICKVSAVLNYQTGDISGKTFNCVIGSLDGSNNLTVVGTSANVAGSNSWSDETVNFTFSSPVTIPASTDYAIVVTMNEIDASNYAEFAYTLNGEIGGARGAWDSAGENYAYSGYDMRIVAYE